MTATRHSAAVEDLVDEPAAAAVTLPTVRPAGAMLSTASIDAARAVARTLFESRHGAFGRPAGPGRATGVAIMLSRSRDVAETAATRVVITRSLSPAWTPAVLRAPAVVTECGDPASEAAAVLRELEVLAVLGARGTLRSIASGSRLQFDGSAGVVAGPRRARSAAWPAIGPRVT